MGGSGAPKLAVIAGMSRTALSSTGLDTRTASLLCYLGWWVTGAVFWLLERDDDRVRLHAAQSVVAFGSLSLLLIALAALSLLALSFAPALVFTTLVIASTAIVVVAFGLWVVALWRASSGESWKMPVFGHLAEQWLAKKKAGSNGPGLRAGNS